MATIDPLLFHGTLLNLQGNAIKDATIQLWQTDLDGNYLHPDPRATANSNPDPDHAAIVSDFQYFGTDATDSNGNFEFLSYRPGIYPNRPYSHFLFMVWLDTDPTDGIVGGNDGEEDSLPALITQFYFKDESPPFPDALQLDVTEVDAGIYNYGSYVNGTIVVGNAVDSLFTEGTTLLAASPAQAKGPFYPKLDFFSMDNDLTAVGDATIQNDGNTTMAPGSSDVITTQPTKFPSFSANASTKSPALGPSPATSSQNNDGMPISTAPSVYPDQVKSSNAAAVTHCHFLGFLWFWLMVSRALL